MARTGTQPASSLSKCAYDPGDQFFVNRGLSATHKGADYSTGKKTGVPVVAMMSGRAVVVPSSSGFGMSVRVTSTMPDGSTVVVTYGHVKGISGINNQIIQAGQIIGTVESAETLKSQGGTLGPDFSGPHLHLRIEKDRVGGPQIDPWTFNPNGESCGVKPVQDNWFNRALAWFRPGDPLVIDLEGDGVSATSGSSDVLFDHNADGVKTGTQWVSPGDGMLVRDLNANGLIDSGRELFGDQTLLSSGSLAANGIAALADLNTNGDSVIDVDDVAYADLKIWRDLNQDGVSQAEELQSLADLGIASINLNANAQGTSSYTRTVTDVNGNASTVVRTVQNVNFSTNPFYREFIDDPEVTESAATLPQIRGAGMVRDLRQAMSLGTDEADSLKQSVNGFKDSSSAQERHSLLAQFISDWGATSSQPDALTRNASRSSGWYNATVGDALAAYAKGNPVQYAMMTALERFNGQSVLERYVRTRSASYYEPSEQRWKGYTYYVVEIEAQRVALFEQAYQALKASVYHGLYLQTQGKELLNLITYDDEYSDYPEPDFTALNEVFSAKAALDAASAVIDLAEFIYFSYSSSPGGELASSNMQGSDWDGAARLADLLETTSFDTTQSAILAGFNYKFSGPVGDTNPGSPSGTSSADVLVGRSGNDILNGNAGDDILIGGQGNDILYGGHGNDQLVGGQGNDYLNGQWGTDTYFWGVGQGHDTIVDGQANVGESNVVVLKDLSPADIAVEVVIPNNYSVFRLTILSTGETLTIDTRSYQDWYLEGIAPVRLVFADGSQWSMDEIIRQTVAFPTDGNDVLVGSPVADRADRLNGGAGDDIIAGREGFDIIEGGTGNDTLYGHARLWSWDTDGNPVAPYWRFDFGASGDSDVYVFGRGDGQDTILDLDYGTNEDTLRFKEGVAAEDLELQQRGNDLLVLIRGTSDQVTIKNFFVNKSYAIERFEFSGGQQWLLSEIKEVVWSGTSQDDVLTGDSAANVIAGGDGNDVIDGQAGDDVLSGGAGHDTLLGGFGNDILDGGVGNDMLYAGHGNDIIRFGRGDGKDFLARDLSYRRLYGTYVDVVDPASRNMVELKEGISPSDVKLVREGSTLHIQIKGTEDVLTVQDFYVNRYEWDDVLEANFSLGEIRFADGTVWGPAEMQAQTLIGDESSESFVGFSGNDVFDGKGGNDRYQGWGGVDTFLFGRGDGADRVNASAIHLVFKDGVSPDDVAVRRVGSDLVFFIRGTTDQIAFDHAMPYWNTEPNYIQSVTFSDGTVWLPSQLTQKLLDGTAGDDVISDRYSPTPLILAGGAGNDTLKGGRSATIYVFNRGDGHEVLDESEGYSDQDVLRFGPDIVATDLQLFTSGDDLIIRIVDTDDQVTIRNHAYSAIEQFEVGGVTLSYAQVLELATDADNEVIYGSTGNDALSGSAKNSSILGFAGDDELSGGAGNDELQGGDGDDTLAGDAGRDLLIGGAGSNTYVYQRGDSLDTIILTPGASDAIQLGEGINASDVTVQLGSRYGLHENVYKGLTQLVIGFGSNDALVLEIPDTEDMDSALQVLNALQFSDGSTLSYADLLALADGGVAGDSWDWNDDSTLRGSQGDDNLSTEGRNAYVEGRDNNDSLGASGAQARLDGGDGDDYLNASGGSALMVGGHGSDYLNAWTNAETNTVAFNQGDGADWVEARDGNGVLSLGANVDISGIRMHVDANDDLVIQFEGSPADEIRTSWYESDGVSTHESRGFDRIQLISADGAVRLFDLTRLEASSTALAILEQGTEDGVAFETLAQMAGLEVLERSAVYGGEAAIAYAQTGSMLGQAYIAANSDLNGDNLLFGTENAETLDGGAGNDVIMAGGGNDVLIGGTGDDVLVGGAGNDELDAGTGNNKAMGGEGDDTYHYARGNGFLLIDDGLSSGGGAATFSDSEGGYGGNDFNTLIFGEGVTFEDLIFERDGDNLKVTVSGVAGDTIVMAGFDEYMESRNRSIDEFIFHDGSSVILDDLWREESDQYLVQRGDDGLLGTEYRDHLIGGFGGDRLEGGYGADRLEGGSGSDVYLIGYDSGNDVIVDTAGDDNIIVVSDWSVTSDDVSLQTDGGQVGIWIGERFITLEGWDGQDTGQSPISSLILQDGSVLEMVDLFNRPRTLVGTPQADLLQGGAGEDVIRGLAGNDHMLGGGGSDTYVIEANSGADTITDTSTPGEENTILFLDGVQPEDIRLSLDSDRNLVIHWADGMQVTLTEFDYQNPLDKVSIAFFQFGEAGPVVSYEELLWRGFEIEGTSGNDVLYTTGYYDVVRGGDGDDLILGGRGDSYLLGEGGNDVYEYRMGDGWVGISDVADASGGNVVRFGEGITPEMLERKLRFRYIEDEPEESALRIVFDEDNVLELSGFSPNDPTGSPHAVEFFEFSDSTVLSWDELLDKVFVVEGYDEASFGDVLEGTGRSDRLYGYAGDDALYAGAGNDVLTGGLGSDVLAGGSGHDNYVFQLGDGTDVIQETGLESNTITFGEGVFEADISVVRDGADLIVQYGTLGDSIRIASPDGVTVLRSVIEYMELADGTLLSFARFVNVAPEVGQALVNQEAEAGVEFTYVVPGDAFSDLDGDSLVFQARLSNGDSLPEWLNFDSATGGFSGTPPMGADGSYSVLVYAIDPSGDAVQQTFQISVSAAVQNEAPIANADAAFVDEDFQAATTGNVLSNDSDPDALDVLTVSNPGTYLGQFGVLVLNQDGSYAYTLDNSNMAIQSLSEGAILSERFGYTVSDGPTFASTELSVTITGRNDAPAVTTTVPGQTIAEDAAWSYPLPDGLFSDIDDGDTLSIEVKLANGDPLPSWIAFNSQTRTLEGTPTNSDVGSLLLMAIGTDAFGANVSVQFELTIENVNDAPQIGTALSSQTATAYYAFTYQIPSGAFSDVDLGESLSYSVTLASGDPLPAWLQFNGETLTLTGKPAQTDVGALQLAVVAMDAQGLSASQVFELTVSPLPVIWGTECDDILDSFLTGSIVYGLSGNDILYGNIGNDVFYGGNGNDKLYAWDGDDILYGENGNDILTGDIGDDVLYGGAGNDSLFGYDGDDVLFGGDGNDYLEGNVGADSLYGGLGDDTYLIEDSFDTVIEYASEGNDSVDAYISFTLVDHVETLTLLGTSAINGTGNALNNYLSGNSASNVLMGMDGIDYLYGYAGDDILDGGADADGMYGGDGNDIYYVDDEADWIQEGSNKGTDTVISTTTRSLGANFENLILVGNAATNGSGNRLANIIIGNDAVNELSGGGGSDTLDGRGGNDTLTGGTGNDTYLFGRGYGTDTVVENGSTSGNTDFAQFLDGVSSDQIWFRQVGNNLEASIIGTSDALILKNWYLGSQYHVEQFKTADEKVLLDSQVQNLVQAMASFAPPAAGQTTLPESYATALNGVIAANWQ